MEEIYGDHAKRITRYAIKKESDVFDLCKLQSYIDQLENEYEVKMINHELYHTAMAHDWSRDLCSQFATYEEYAQYGLGAVVLHNGLLVSGASSYTVYKEGIEIEIDTRADYRRKGLGLACAARLIIAFLVRGLYPSRDAQNMGSVELAKKLGYHCDKEYVSYEVYDFGCV